MEPVIISHGLAEAHRQAAAELYLEAFGPLLQPLLGDAPRSLNVLERSLNPQYALVATRAGQLVGLAGYQDEDGALIALRMQSLVQEYGPLNGCLRYLGMGLLLSRDRPPGALLMDGIAVAPGMRGQGIGTQLLEALCRHAHDRGYRSVRLDVLDSNPRARNLYERAGFVAVKEQSYPFLQRFFGFSAVTEMRRPL